MNKLKKPLLRILHDIRSYCSKTTSYSVSRAGNIPDPIPLTFATCTIWGANTGIGKTLVSIGLADAARRSGVPLLYLKPAQTGFPDDSDARVVALAYGTHPVMGPHAAMLAPEVSFNHAHEEPVSRVKVMHAWSSPVSPHLAVSREGRPVSDRELLTSVSSELIAFARRLEKERSTAAGGSSQKGIALLETAGGVASPAPSGELQCNVLRPLRLPCLLVGDPRLGGISSTISAYESLTNRGYDVDMVVIMDREEVIDEGSTGHVGTSLGVNAQAVQQYFSKTVHRLGMKTQVVSLAPCPLPKAANPHHGRESLDGELQAWLLRNNSAFDLLLNTISDLHHKRIAKLSTLAKAASQRIWWPFTQHASLKDDAVQVIDSRNGEHWQVLSPSPTSPTDNHLLPALNPLYDGCSSWWTQVVPARLQPEVAQAVAYAAGRYLHVMFPENAHEPAVALAGKLLETVGSGWASRVFYSDDGSTAIEVALKMAFRKFMHDRGLDTEAGPIQLQVLGLQNAYHGDTLGAMDCVAPSVYNGRLQAPWYRGRGVFLNPPYVSMVEGRWILQDPPDWLQESLKGANDANTNPGWSSLDDVLDASRDQSILTQLYRQYIEDHIDMNGRNIPEALLGANGTAGGLAAAVIEPLLQGAGGMLLVDPQFQRAMVQACRSHNIPIIFDEVMTGLYRLGAISAAALLRETPDIACYAKILTAGAVPMAATLTTAEVFEAFSGPSKLQALLHGHSYTAYPIGCVAALTALDILSNPSTNPNLCTPQPIEDLLSNTQSSSQGLTSGTSNCTCRNGGPLTGTRVHPVCSLPCGRLIPLWDDSRVMRLSHHSLVSRVLAIGTVAAIELSARHQTLAEAGQPAYATGGLAVEVARRLRRDHGVYCRPLGPVVYLMVPPTVDRARCDELLGAMESVLDALAAKGPGAPEEEGVIV